MARGRPLNVTFRLSDAEWLAMTQAALLLDVRPSELLRVALAEKVARVAEKQAADAARVRRLEHMRRNAK